MKAVGIIPARYASTRFPGKALADIKGKPMIQWVYEQALKSNLDAVVIATDNELIAEKIRAFGGRYIMTSERHRTGTERCIAAFEQLLEEENERYDVLVNIQGDEPFIHPAQINLLLSAFEDRTEYLEEDAPEVVTLAKKIDKTKDLFDPNVVKVAFANDDTVDRKDALYFSRQAIPFLRGEDRENWVNRHAYYKHIGIYAFSSHFALEQYFEFEASPLAEAEALEQLEWMENYVVVQVIVSDIDTKGVDTPEDLDHILDNWSEFQED